MDKQITDIKQMWFQSRRTGGVGGGAGMGPLGVIRETMDEDGAMYGQGMMGMGMDGNIMWTDTFDYLL